MSKERLKNIKLLKDFLEKYPNYKEESVYDLMERVSDIIRKRLSNKFVGFHKDDIELFINPANFSYGSGKYPAMSLKNKGIVGLFQENPLSFIDSLKKLV
jgi:hypothetical protein